MNISKIKTPLFFILIIFLSNANATSIRLDDGIWAGIKEVNINGKFWDATFLAGSFSSASPTIQSLSFANEAALSIDALFTTGGAFHNSIYDLDPLLAMGNSACTEFIFGRCWLATPYEQSQFGIFAASFANERGHALDHATTSWGVAKNSEPNHTIWVEWSQSANVPIPSAVWLFITSFFGLLSVRRSR